VQRSFGFYEESALFRIAAHTQCQTELTEIIGRLAVSSTRQLITDPRLPAVKISDIFRFSRQVITLHTAYWGV